MCSYSVVGTPAPAVNSEHLQPSKQLVSIISKWLENKPQFLYAASPIEKTDLLSFHGANKSTHQAAPAVSPLAGLMQWCVLAPCHHTKPPSEREDNATGTAEKTSTQYQTLNTVAYPSSTGEKNASLMESSREEEGGNEQGGKVDDKEMNFQMLVAKLHANLLSVILSDSQLFPHGTLTSDHVAVTVAALLGLSKHTTLAQRKKRGKMMASAAEETGDRDREKSKDLEESVERLAQFLQISLSTGLLALSAG